MDVSHASGGAASAVVDAAAIAESWHEPERFTELFHRHYQGVHGYVARRVGPDAADDIAAETFLAAFRQRRRFDPDRGAVRPWLYGIATNLIGLHRRSEIRFYRALARTPAQDVVESHEERAADRVSAASSGGELARALSRLSPGDRDVLLLIALADLTYEEVAQALDLKQGTVASRLNRARRKLRAALGETTPLPTTEESPA
ncbi:RNA polymerase sigma factor [Actinomadura parmotrematis]|uniref:RNA polymerase sigma factor n=1 Tax=Actinomadura parmotrematis TaxID=2864039 RepID=A0ABS7G206_9ACTN|nr:RNA polymerase sigma factor [Actinomadura parmotrematis]MBW8486742.1 RNA polymerase sigma factor [Actinomadura parmotrematis]